MEMPIKARVYASGHNFKELICEINKAGNVTVTKQQMSAVLGGYQSKKKAAAVLEEIERVLKMWEGGDQNG